METSKQGWVPDEESIRNTCWAVTFIGMDVIREIPEKPHSIVELRDDMNCYTVGGVPLVQHKWWIANGELRGKLTTKIQSLPLERMAANL